MKYTYVRTISRSPFVWIWTFFEGCQSESEGLAIKMSFLYSFPWQNTLKNKQTSVGIALALIFCTFCLIQNLHLAGVFHIQWGSCPSGSGVSTQVIATLCSCCQGERQDCPPLHSRHRGPRWRGYELYGCVCVCMLMWLWAHLHGLVHMHFQTCECLCARVCTHRGSRGRAAVPVCWLTDSLLVNEQLSAITIHEPCHSPPLSKHQHLKPWNP